QTKEARAFRYDRAARRIVQGSAFKPALTPSASRWPRGANGSIALPARAHGASNDLPRYTRPPKIACESEQHLNRLVDQDGVQQRSLYSQESCRELAAALANRPGLTAVRASATP